MVIVGKGTWSFWSMTIPLCREVGSGRDNGRHVRRTDRLEPKDVWMTQRLDTAPKLWMFSAPSARHYVSALRRDGLVVASEVELFLFTQSVWRKR